MHGFRDNEVLPTGHDVNVSPPPGKLHTLFHNGFWKSDHDFQFMIHSNFLATMHGFRDNEVLLPTGNDVIVITRLGGVSHRFCWRNLNERNQFHNHGSLIYFAYLWPFRSYSTFYFGWLLRIPTNFRGVLRVKTPQNFRITLISSPKGSSLH